MGSRGQPPDAMWKTILRGLSSSFGPLGKGAQSVSRCCQSQEGVEEEGHRSDRPLPVRQKLCLNHNDQFVEVHQRQVAARRVMQTWPKKRVNATSASLSSDATRLRADHVDAGIH